MTQNIQKLLTELISYTYLNSRQTLSSLAKDILSSMREEFYKLESSNDANKQSKMISLFIGGTIYALIQDDDNYGYGVTLYPGRNSVSNALKNSNVWKIKTEDIYAIGNEALAHLPQAFYGDLFKIEANLINTSQPTPFFPELKLNAEKIDLLVKFCIKYHNDLERSEVETGDLVSIDLKIAETSSKIEAPQYKPSEPSKHKEDSKTNYSAEPHEYKRSNPSKPKEDSKTNSSSIMNISMQVLGGFMAVIGCAAVAAAFILLNAATFGVAGLVVAGLGAASALVGFGLFATGTYKNTQIKPNESLDHSADFAY